MSRRSLQLPILLAIAMIVLLLILAVGWVLLSVFGILTTDRFAAVYWVLLSLGTTFLLLVLAGTVIYLVLTIKAINLSRRQSNFIDSVTHELKSPIASMKLYLQTLERHQVGAEEQARFYQIMLDDLDRLDRLINQMLEAGRVESGSSDGEEEDVELSPMLADIAAAVCESYRQPASVVTVDNVPCMVRARRNELELLFRNLIDNAVKYGASPPAVAVSLRLRPPDRAEIVVADNGRGIPRHLRRKVFGRFVRLGSELERDRPGTGLGLYIVRTIVRRLRGKVSIRDRGDQSGTAFEVQLPARGSGELGS